MEMENQREQGYDRSGKFMTVTESSYNVMQCILVIFSLPLFEFMKSESQKVK